MEATKIDDEGFVSVKTDAGGYKKLELLAPASLEDINQVIKFYEDRGVKVPDYGIRNAAALMGIVSMCHISEEEAIRNMKGVFSVF